MSLSATARGCIRDGSNPFQDVRFKVYLSTAADEDYFTLIKDQALPIKAAAADSGVPFCTADDMKRVLKVPE